MKNKDGGIDFNKYGLKAPGSYLDDMTELLRTADEADKKARELSREVSESREKSEKAPEKTLDELLAELDELVGLQEIKANVRSLINLVKVRKMREENSLPNTDMSLHLVFTGNPGTGKTTVARLIASLYHSIGVLPKGQLIETDRSGLVAGYVGQTAQKTLSVINSAIGGVLFIDEAYSLAPEGSGNDFGHEAIETILKAMEDHRSDLVVIVAGYLDEMERFITSNPGLESRFNRYFLFPDYNAAELFDIFRSMCDKNKYTLTPEAEAEAKAHLEALYIARDENFGNAREVRNFFENAVSAHSDRVAALTSPTKEDLTVFARADIEKASKMH